MSCIEDFPIQVYCIDHFHYTSYRITIDLKDIAQIPSSDRICNKLVISLVLVSSIHPYHEFVGRGVAFCENCCHQRRTELRGIVIQISHVYSDVLSTLEMEYN